MGEPVFTTLRGPRGEDGYTSVLGAEMKGRGTISLSDENGFGLPSGRSGLRYVSQVDVFLFRSVNLIALAREGMTQIYR